ncbi:hypothetical protein OBBRIDRAFT_792050 [Obba rivulosa]|uniref:BZIP domain-containing protein n=1 Tax=Obba rivulosa TaxID=1052685 RepID=A0A8E2B0P3_9APHY|nr:hypothetical protein OBBRIDRAFT_792050 [Obba rivulosa]
MAPSNLQGLNIVHPAPPPNPYASDAELLSIPPFPDLNAQLELWTHLNFQSDEPLVSAHGDHSEKDKHAKRGHGEGSEGDLDRYNEQDEDLQRAGIAETTAHENVVTGTVLPPTGFAHSGHAHAASAVPIPGMNGGMNMPLDFSSLLAGFGLDPFTIPSVPPPPPATANSLAQLLSLHAAAFRPQQPAAVQPVPAQAQMQPSPVQATSPQTASPTTSTIKRARTSRASISSVDMHSEASPGPEEEKTSGTPFTAAEDKRRRNTAASARFRLKKKEREAALERKAKELELRVGELEKECEALRRENGWLKGLVVGVTGAGAVQQQVGGPSPSVAGAKRAREEEEIRREQGS